MILAVIAVHVGKLPAGFPTVVDSFAHFQTLTSIVADPAPGVSAGNIGGSTTSHLDPGSASRAGDLGHVSLS